MGVGIASLASSCLKDLKTPADAALGTNNVVQFQNISVPVAYNTTYPQYDLGGLDFLYAEDTAGWNIIVSWTGPEFTAPQDITVTLALDTAALDGLSAANNKTYTNPPADVVDYPTSIVIKAGTSQTIVRCTAKIAADFDYTANYALPLTISAASMGQISTNYGTALFTFGDKNVYDGLYSLTEKLTGWSAYGIADGETYTWGTNILYVTTGQYSNMINTVESGVYLPEFSPTGGENVFGATTCQITIDPNTNLVASVNNTQPDDGRDRALALNPAVTDSRYDPSSKTIYVSFIMTQTGRPQQFFYDTLVYQGSR